MDTCLLFGTTTRLDKSKLIDTICTFLHWWLVMTARKHQQDVTSHQIKSNMALDIVVTR